jgi:hypothetical protein
VQRGEGDPFANTPFAETRLVSKSKTEAGMRQWILEWDHAKGVVASHADVVDRPGETASSVAARASRVARGVRAAAGLHRSERDGSEPVRAASREERRATRRTG